MLFLRSALPCDVIAMTIRHGFILLKKQGLETPPLWAVRCPLIVAFASVSIESRLLVQPFKEPVTGDDGPALNDLELGKVFLSYQLVSAGTGDAEKTCHFHYGEEHGKLISVLIPRLSAS